MTTDFHTPHSFGAPLTSSEVNSPLAELDAQIGRTAGMVVNTFDFGVVGDGVTDDWASIQAALDSIPVGFSGAGATVILPAGKFAITKPLWIKSRATVLRGVAGAYATTISPTAGFAIGSAPVLAAIVAKTTDHAKPDGIGLENITVKMTDTATGHGLYFYHHTRAHLTNVWVHDVPSNYYGIRVEVDSDIVSAGGTDVSETIVWTNVNVEYKDLNASGTLVRLDRCQEMTMVGVKIIGSATTSTTETSVALHLDTPRGITMLGCSTAFAKTHILIENNHATGSTTIGHVYIYGHTHEGGLAAGNALKVNGVTARVLGVEQHGIRYLSMNASPITLLNSVNGVYDSVMTNSTPVTLDASSSGNIVRVRLGTQVTDSGTTNTVEAVDDAKSTYGAIPFARKQQVIRGASSSLAAGATEDVTLTWPVAWPSTNYTFVVTGRNTSSAADTISVQGLTKAAGSIVVRVKNKESVSARVISLEAISILD